MHLPIASIKFKQYIQKFLRKLLKAEGSFSNNQFRQELQIDSIKPFILQQTTNFFKKLPASKTFTLGLNYTTNP